MDKDNLNSVAVFTDNFPTGTGEVFFWEEMKYLEMVFEKINLFSLFQAPNNPEIKLAEHTKVHDREAIHRPRMRDVMYKHAGLILTVMRFCFAHAQNKTPYYRKPLFHVKQILFAIIDAYRLHKVLEGTGTKLFYSYWYNDWVPALAMYKKLFDSEIRIVCRTHGYDVDLNQLSSGYYKFREWTNEYINEVVCISEYGKKLFSKANPTYKKELSVSYLGVQEKPLSPVPKGKIYRIVSCSSAIPIKRLDKIAGMLAYSTHSILWVHFGDGPELEKLRKYINNFPKNIGFEAKGHVSNEKLMAYYRDTEIDVFINTSLFEGIPYAMIEAAAHGIPLAGFNVCGIPEILEKDMGILLDPGTDIKENSAKLKSFLLSGFCTDVQYRENVREKTREKFSASTNYAELMVKLKSSAA